MKASNVVLAIFPNTRGFGYACVEGNDTLLESGVANVRPANNLRVMERLVGYVEYFRPTLVLLRDPETGPPSEQRKRVRELVTLITRMCRDSGLPVVSYSREQIRDTFSVLGISSKYEAAKALSDHFGLRLRMVRPPRPYDKEHYHMGRFDALSLVAVHRYLTE